MCISNKYSIDLVKGKSSIKSVLHSSHFVSGALLVEVLVAWCPRAGAALRGAVQD